MTAAPVEDPKLGPLLEHPVPVHFIGGPLCGATLASRMAGEVHVWSEQVTGRLHVYRRIGLKRIDAEVVFHREIREERRS